MKKILISVLAVSALSAAALPAMAAPWQNINQRQAQLDRRIDMGVRNGQLTRNEAYRLRTEFRQITQLEVRYRRTGGLQGWERADLDRRFDVLSRKIRIERHDRDDRRPGGPGYGGGYGPGAAYDSDRDGRPDRVDRFSHDPRRW
jgi:hypothetical protein